MPQFNAPEVPKDRTTTLLIVGMVTVAASVVVMLIAAQFGAGRGVSAPATPSQRQATAPAAYPSTGPASGLVVEGAAAVAGQYSNTITGTVRNTSTHSYDFVQVDINLFDASGVQVGSTQDGVGNLAAGGVWKFEVAVYDKKATSFKVVGVKGY